MNNNSSAVIALIFLVILGIVIAVALAYNPAPAVIVPPPQKSSKDILLEKNKTKDLCKSSMSPPRSQLSPSSDNSAVPTAWEHLNAIRQNRTERNAI